MSLIDEGAHRQLPLPIIRQNKYRYEFHGQCEKPIAYWLSDICCNDSVWQGQGSVARARGLGQGVASGKLLGWWMGQEWIELCTKHGESNSKINIWKLELTHECAF